jgi:glycosyltransferase involved in cell wall biosynthesis
MTFVIITHVPHVKVQSSYFAYGPYVREMNIWIKQADKVIVLAPIAAYGKTAIDSDYVHDNIEFVSIDNFDVLSLKALLKTIAQIPEICWKIYTAMQKGDHIHLRCPGNVGLLGCFVQIFFPSKLKSAKYAGNWDPKAKQPWSYKMQRWILNNTFLTRNMQVLVYGEWPNQSKNIKPFFTATYGEEDKLQFVAKDFNSKIQFVFVGTLVKGKNPLYAIQLTEALIKKGHQVALSLYGEGVERESLQGYLFNNNLERNIILKGNQNQEVIKKAYQESHFVILASESEGWPKAIAEGMFWGCIPLATRVSCVPFMLDYGKRGILLDMDLEKDVEKTEMLLNNQTDFNVKSENASNWSRNYTLDVFEREIIGVLKQNLQFNK